MKTSRKREHAELDAKLDKQAEAQAAIQTLDTCRKAILQLAHEYPLDSHLLELARSIATSGQMMYHTHAV
jgi:hypothetical protein